MPLPLNYWLITDMLQTHSTSLQKLTTFTFKLLQFTDPVHSIFRYFCSKLLGRLKQNNFVTTSHLATETALFTPVTRT